MELYEAVGLVYEDEDGLLRANIDLVDDEEVIVRIENLLLGMTSLVGSALPVPPRTVAVA